MPRLSLLALALALAAAGCSRTGYPGEGGDGASRDSDLRDGGGSFEQKRPGAISIANLHAVWGTANSIRWEWEATGNADALLSYTLVVATSEKDLLTRSGSAVVFSAKENPELGTFYLPRTGGKDQVVGTMTDGHAPETPYYALLEATDTSLLAQRSNVAAGRTTVAPTGEVVVFSEAATAGSSLPDSFVLTAGCGLQGSTCYSYTSKCQDGGPICFENLRRRGLELDLGGISEGNLATTAFYEFAVACSGDHSYWSNGRLWLGGSAEPTGLFVYDGFSIRCDDRYRVVQLPLRIFAGDSPLTYPDLARGLYEFTVGGFWSHGAQVRIDEVRIRW
jgi:hypothetical protein